jgi:hypothetical protein
MKEEDIEEEANSEEKKKTKELIKDTVREANSVPRILLRKRRIWTLLSI